MTRQKPSLFEVMYNFTKYRILQPIYKKPFPPNLLVLYVNYRCNARCIMCGIWENPALYPKEAELTVEEIGKILSDRLFKQISRLNINGGELSLRSDLPEIIQISVDRLPHLKELSLSSNGILTERLVDQVKQIKKICSSKNIKLSVIISLHGLSETQDKVMGIRGAYDRQVKTLDALDELAKETNITYGAYCVINQLNVKHLDTLRDWATARNLKLGYSVVEKRERFDNLEKADQFELAAEDKILAVEFLRKLSQPKSILNASAYTYDYLANLLHSNQKRTISCDYRLGGVILGSQGELFYCPHSEVIGNCRENSAFKIYYSDTNLQQRESKLIRHKCVYCPPREVGRISIQVDILKYLIFALKKWL